MCVARKPKCEICRLSQWCKYYKKNFGAGITIN
ncbi:hypothetical protein [uncultured Proteiniphilum sp.]|nr:hypothetical protein [uncultured Proteiniphilum sp.]